jgi:hypothetical protein
LIIGCDYLNHKSGQLRGCNNDALDGFDHHEQFGLVPENTLLLLDDPSKIRAQRLLARGFKIQMPTRKNIEQGMKWLAEGATNDILLLTYSGHGTQTKDKVGDESDGFDEAICPVDYDVPENRGGGLIVDDWIRQNLVTPLPETVTLISWMDCCHSGTVFDLRYKRKVRMASSSAQQQQQPLPQPPQLPIHPQQYYPQPPHPLQPQYYPQPHPQYYPPHSQQQQQQQYLPQQYSQQQQQQYLPHQPPQYYPSQQQQQLYFQQQFYNVPSVKKRFAKRRSVKEEESSSDDSYSSSESVFYTKRTSYRTPILKPSVQRQPSYQPTTSRDVVNNHNPSRWMMPSMRTLSVPYQQQQQYVQIQRIPQVPHVIQPCYPCPDPRSGVHFMETLYGFTAPFGSRGMASGLTTSSPRKISRIVPGSGTRPEVTEEEYPNYPLTNAHVFMMSGCRDDQTSADTTENNKNVGAMSAARQNVLNAANAQGIKLTWSDLQDRMLVELKSKDYDQVPQLTYGRKENLATSYYPLQ